MSKDLFALNQTPKGKKPTGDYVIDWSNPLTKGLKVFLVAFNGAIVNLVDGTVYPQSATVYTSKGNVVMADDVDGIEYGSLDYSSTDDYLSVYTKVSYFNITTDHALIDIHNQNLLVWADTTAGGLRAGMYSGGSRHSADGALNTTNGEFISWGSCVRTNSTDSKLYIDGTVAGTGSPGVIVANTEELTIFSQETLTSKSSNAEYEYLFLSVNKLNDTQFKSLHADPYQILKPASSLQDALYIAVQSALGPIAVDDYYTATSGTQLVVPAVTGILANDTYTA